MNIEAEQQNWTSVMNIRAEQQNWTSVMNIKAEQQNWTAVMNIKTEHQSWTSELNIKPSLHIKSLYIMITIIIYQSWMNNKAIKGDSPLQCVPEYLKLN